MYNSIGAKAKTTIRIAYDEIKADILCIGSKGNL